MLVALIYAAVSSGADPGAESHILLCRLLVKIKLTGDLKVASTAWEQSARSIKEEKSKSKQTSSRSLMDAVSENDEAADDQNVKAEKRKGKRTSSRSLMDAISENGEAANDQIVKEERIGGDQNVKEEKRKSKGKVKALFDVVFEQSGIGLAAALAPRKGGLAPPGNNW
jgi:hypothetical protein